MSLLYVMENGASAEIDVVGNEGIVGISLFMGAESMKAEFNLASPVLHLLLRYTQALITQIKQ